VGYNEEVARREHGHILGQLDHERVVADPQPDAVLVQVCRSW
jgi:hypothetical protein